MSTYSQSLQAAMTFAPDGHLAFSTLDGQLSAFGPDEYVPRWSVFQQPPNAYVPAQRGLGIGPLGRLYVVSTYEGDAALTNLTIIDPKPITTVLDVNGPTTVKVRKLVTLTGRLAPEDGYPPGTQTLHVTRTDRLGTTTLADVRTSGDGAFSFTDPTRVPGEVSWTIQFDGTDRLTAVQSGWRLIS